MAIVDDIAAMELSAEQFRQYETQGYLVVEDVFSDESIRTLKDEADRVMETVINASLATGRESERLDIIDQQGQQMVRTIKGIIDLSLTYSRMEQALREPISEIIDGEPCLLAEKLNYKQPLPEPVDQFDLPSDISAFKTHSDWAHLTQYPQSFLTTAVLIDDHKPDRGPLHLWPGSHTREHDHRKVEDRVLQVPSDELNKPGEDLIAPAGSVVFFHSLLLHSSRPNKSGLPRRMMHFIHYPEADGERSDIDDYNSSIRIRESAHEWEYIKQLQAGEAEPRFVAPEY